jgi:hypothetical protein
MKHPSPRRRRWLAAALWCAAHLGLNSLPAAAQGTAAATQAPPAIELFFQRPAFSQAQLSPDGKRVAMLVADKVHPARLAVLDLTTMTPTVVASFGEVGVNHFRWVNDQRLVFDLEIELTGPGRAEIGAGLFAVNADGSVFRPLVETTYGWLKAPDSGAPLLRWDHSESVNI